ncbi:MAG: modulator of FtsH protease HflK [Sphingomonadales bacterium]|jgi:membrane protease subunit HflK|nr:modulator of FtsH protease HflK [Sphingomonadales bacterium]MEA3049296.1 modulator of FtsH protease HflK [Sphingomonadales bacterium]
MRAIWGWGARLAGSWSENKGGPWGPSGGGSGGGDGDGEGPRSPWGQPPRRRRTPGGPSNISSIEDFLKKGRERFGGRFPNQDRRPYWAYGLAIFLLLWLLFTSFHRVGPQEEGVVTLFGRYSRTVGPGINFTLPLPIESLERVDTQIRSMSIGAEQGEQENLILTGDENIIDLAYTIRWKVRDPALYLFNVQDPEATIHQVAESAMRASVATVSLDDAIGAGRGEIENRVQALTQQVLDRYGAGVQIQGVSIRQSDPPDKVNDAFKAVTTAQQEAQSYINQARGYAQQVTARAQGEAAAFDKVYAQYKLAPEVTRRRMYYETMERVLSKVDKTVVEAPGVVPYLSLPNPRAKAAEGDQR